jgi:hypothetical protein
VNIVIVNWQRPLWEGPKEVVKRSARDEPMWVAIHKCLEAMLGISLYVKLCFFLNKIRGQEGRTDSSQKGVGKW